ncbi:hypothetical protein [Chitinophaga ginsengisoli]|uniref:Cytochrome B n=1 Tax=Chitinophaga ginsengisoli TaxID=363837 RepID=A0A2P8G2I3_9BACT|nr:hypothetical protein [Chitinophaga ginsengisoli]PSL28156.1 hypothetical protein CLV42_10875 [Chitinophaga ginsengisoli]
MYFALLVLHSLLRWLMLGSLCYAIYTAFRGVSQRLLFTGKVNAIRHWTTTIAHIQLLVGMTIYIQSPLVNMKVAGVASFNQHTFFKYVHISLMMLAIVLITIGSARAKRVTADQEKYKTMLTWFLIALVVILIAIPWPFSPLAQRPWLRLF